MKESKPLPKGKCRCGICGVILDMSQRKAHFESKKHLDNLMNPALLDKAYKAHCKDMEESMRKKDKK